MKQVLQQLLICHDRYCIVGDSAVYAWQSPDSGQPFGYINVVINHHVVHSISCTLASSGRL